MLHSRRFLFTVVLVCIVLVAGTSVGVIYLRLKTSPVLSTRTLPVPPTQTSCPKEGTARTTITAPLMLGTHPNVVYLVNYKGTTVTAPRWTGTLQRYDTTTGKNTVIVKTPYMAFSRAQVSADGQWILFVAEHPGKETLWEYELRMVRMDGQGLQTLYCTSLDALISSSSPAWSPNQQSLAFAISDQSTVGGLMHVYLLDLSSGTLQPAIAPQTELVYDPSQWLNNTQLYISSDDAFPLYLLDTKDGPNQSVEQLHLIADRLCQQSYDLSSDHTHLFTIQCSGTGNTPDVPSTISVQSATGGPSAPIYSSLTLAITNIRVVNTTTILFNASNTYDTSQNGLWKINTDGSNLVHLATDYIKVGASNDVSGEPWLSISRDGHMYATGASKDQSKPSMLIFGSLSGGVPTTLFPSHNKDNIINNGESYTTVGWTTM